MKTVLYRLALTAALAGAACSSSITAPSGDPASATARYRVTFQATWSAASHPIDFPSAAHFSPLVGGTHNGQVTFWREGAIATDGIKDMAERGLTSTLSAEINAAIAAKTAERVFTGGNIADSPGSATAEFEISRDYPLVTLVSMIAPSPDWFVGVSACRYSRTVNGVVRAGSISIPGTPARMAARRSPHRICRSHPDCRSPES